MLAFLAATARDHLLREMTPFALNIPIGNVLKPATTAEHIQHEHPARFSARTLLSTAQSLASSWTQAGYLVGKATKRRIRLNPTPPVLAFAFLLGYLQGSRGSLLLESPWARLLDHPTGSLVELAVEASKQGWMSFKASGAVVEITFPGVLTASEERAAHEQDRLSPS